MSRGATASLESLTALNREMLALARGGLPLAPELTSSADALPGEASALGKRIGGRLEAGDSLSDALAAEPALPDYYAALVRAGEATGQLPAALEGVADALARTLRLRRTCLLALAYPVFVAIAAWGLLVFATDALLPEYDWVAQASAGESLARTIQWLHGLVRYGPIAIIVVALAAAFWLAGGMGPLAAPLGVASRAPGVGRVLRLTASATYCRLLALMLERRTPLPEALKLASEATGWPPFESASRQIAESLRKGDAPSPHDDALAKLPPLLRPALVVRSDSALVSEAINDAAATYEERATLATETTAALLPVIASCVLGGGAVVVFAAVVFWPYAEALKSIASWF